MNLYAQLIEAARFLTRVPLPQTPQKSFNLSDTFMMFPVVGGLIGAVSGVVLVGAALVGLPPFLSAILSVTVTIFLTGGLHEDGIADVADGLGGGTTVERKLEIMRDSSLGTYGALCLFLIVAAKLSVLASLFGRVAPFYMIIAVLIASAALSRTMMVGLVSILPPARKDGVAASLDKLPKGRSLVAYGLALAIVAVALWPVLSLVGIGVAIVWAIFAACFIGALALSQIGGHTGDVAGAVQQLSEIAFLFAIVALL